MEKNGLILLIGTNCGTKELNELISKEDQVSCNIYLQNRREHFVFKF